MGHLHYGSPPASFAIPDRTLAHVEFVVLAKLRRKEAFALSVDGDAGARQQVWINPSSTCASSSTARRRDQPGLAGGADRLGERRGRHADHPGAIRLSGTP